MQPSTAGLKGTLISGHSSLHVQRKLGARWVRDPPQNPVPVHTELPDACSLGTVLSSGLTETEASVLAHRPEAAQLSAGNSSALGRGTWGGPQGICGHPEAEGPLQRGVFREASGDPRMKKSCHVCRQQGRKGVITTKERSHPGVQRPAGGWHMLGNTAATQARRGAGSGPGGLRVPKARFPCVFQSPALLWTLSTLSATFHRGLRENEETAAPSELKLPSGKCLFAGAAVRSSRGHPGIPSPSWCAPDLDGGREGGWRQAGRADALSRYFLFWKKEKQLTGESRAARRGANGTPVPHPSPRAGRGAGTRR